MKYRSFGKLDWKPSALGFGAMRFPILNGDNSQIDEQASIQLIQHAIDHGVNYIDSAYVYHGGNSETLVGKALRDGYWKKVKVATKLPVWEVQSVQDMDGYFNEQLKRLQTNKIDFYLLHSLSKSSWPRIRDLGVFDWAEKKIAEGKIGYLGFSFHDEYPLFEEIVDSYPWTFCQIQYNYLDEDYQAGVRGLKYAASKDLGVIVMEPIAGGRLAVHPPEAIEKLWTTSERKRSPADWALTWVWNQPEVSLLLSGMNTIQQIDENIVSAEKSGPNTLTNEELELIKNVAKMYKEINPIGCSGCRYCTPCPSNVAIPEIFSCYNQYFAKNGDDSVKKAFREAVKPEQWSENCTKCGRCEELCPQHLKIQELIAQAGILLQYDR